MSKDDATIFDLSAHLPGGQIQALEDYRGKVLLVVNTASKCGFTPQYKGLEQLHQEFSDQGLVVLGFPCNQFGHQEPGTADEIAEFCELNFGVTFPLFDKVEVNGPGADPVFKLLKAQAPGVMGSEVSSGISPNFWWGAMAVRSGVTPPRPRRKPWRTISGPCWRKDDSSVIQSRFGVMHGMQVLRTGQHLSQERPG